MDEPSTWRKTSFAKPFYKSRAWQDARSVVLDRAHGLCERCLERGEVRPADVVHHKTPLSPENVTDLNVRTRTLRSSRKRSGSRRIASTPPRGSS